MVEFKFEAPTIGRGFFMVKGNFYFIKNEYFDRFKDKFLMQNKEKVSGEVHNRPCFYAFKDDKTDLLWLIPFSSQIDKFKKIYDDKVNKYKKCDTVVFGEVLGYEKAFLIQNICPITEDYIENEYVDSNNNPVKVEEKLEKELVSKAKKVVRLVRNGIKLTFTDILKIEKELLSI